MSQPIVYPRNIREDSVHSGTMLGGRCHNFFKERECVFKRKLGSLSVLWLISSIETVQILS